MDAVSRDAINKMQEYVDALDGTMKRSFENIHQGNSAHALSRFLKAREGVILKANQMLDDTLRWRLDNDIDNILAKPIEPKSAYDAIRHSQLIGMSGFCKKGRPVFAIGVGHSGYDKAAMDKYVQSHIQLNEYRDRVVLPQASKRAGRFIGSCIKILDMTGLKISALSRMKILTIISTVDDLNYPEKSDTYYIVNAPYVFTACWKAVRPMLQERTKRKVQVLQGCGKEELLEVMDEKSLPVFCRFTPKQLSGSSRDLGFLLDPTQDCFSPAHPFHVEVYEYMKKQAALTVNGKPIISQKSYHVQVPEPVSTSEGGEMAHFLETTIENLHVVDKNGKAKVNGLSRKPM
eukprot:TRINITY_DN14923_c0_g1_i2.p1 TRINITY_DN14923_c0_g1~~TRINITY_DN14923_c0_g1_i2.p1  ORF type:complete len:347 (-),score=57.06 TRINITY_DN14923_c0_g1_i2:518-1558(-)